MTKKIKVEGLRVLECGDAELLQENGTRIVVDRAIWLKYEPPIVAMPEFLFIFTTLESVHVTCI